MPSRALIIDIDSLRPDHVGTYGYPRETTPVIDSIAADGVRFTGAYAANTPCMPSRAGLLTGRHGLSNGVETHGAPAQTLNSPETWDIPRQLDVDPDEWRTLPQLTFDSRLPTLAVSSFPRHPAPWFHQTWHAFRIPQEPQGIRETFATPRASTITDHALDLIKGRNEFLLYAQFWEPHVPYIGKGGKEFEREVVGHPYPTDEAIEAHAEWDAPHTPDVADIGDHADLGETLAAYDAEIAYVDAEIGRLIDRLKERGLYDETLIVVLADHGEEFGAHGIYKHHSTVYEGTQHIPLIIKPPASCPHQCNVNESLVANLDVPATVADYLALPTPNRWHGQSLRGAVEGGGIGRETLLLDHGLYTAQRALRTERWKLVRTLHGGAWDHLPEVQLFNLEADPWEQENVADEHPETVTHLQERLDARRDALLDRRQDDPLREVANRGPTGHRFWREWTD